MMKIVKLTRQHKAHRDGYRYAVRCVGYHNGAGAVEQFFADHLGRPTYSRWNQWHPWSSTSGSRDKTTGYTVWWINFSDPSMITMLVLMGLVEKVKCEIS
ncbi:MAG TPA: hypothetical protein VFM18_18430 [Methanosarcina sp.]|nr:hypothetical protein [Methanosarcina sp.]